MIALIVNVAMIALAMWSFFRFMYPRPPKAFLPQSGDDIRLRTCDYCGNALATYRGIYEKDGIETDPPLPKDSRTKDSRTKDDPKAGKTSIFKTSVANAPVPKEAGERFFCNDEHRQAFYQATADGLMNDGVIKNDPKSNGLDELK